MIIIKCDKCEKDLAVSYANDYSECYEKAKAQGHQYIISCNNIPKTTDMILFLCEKCENKFNEWLKNENK